MKKQNFKNAGKKPPAKGFYAEQLLALVTMVM